MTREVALSTVGKSGGERGGWQGVREEPLRESSALPAGRTQSNEEMGVLISKEPLSDA